MFFSLSVQLDAQVSDSDAVALWLDRNNGGQILLYISLVFHFFDSIPDLYETPAVKHYLIALIFVHSGKTDHSWFDRQFDHSWFDRQFFLHAVAAKETIKGAFVNKTSRLRIIRQALEKRKIVLTEQTVLHLLCHPFTALMDLELTFLVVGSCETDLDMCVILEKAAQRLIGIPSGVSLHHTEPVVD